MKTCFHSRGDDRLHERSELSLSPSHEKASPSGGLLMLRGCGIAVMFDKMTLLGPVVRSSACAVIQTPFMKRVGKIVSIVVAGLLVVLAALIIVVMIARTTDQVMPAGFAEPSCSPKPVGTRVIVLAEDEGAFEQRLEQSSMQFSNKRVVGDQIFYSVSSRSADTSEAFSYILTAQEFREWDEVVSSSASWSVCPL